MKLNSSLYKGFIKNNKTNKIIYIPDVNKVIIHTSLHGFTINRLINCLQACLTSVDHYIFIQHEIISI